MDIQELITAINVNDQNKAQNINKIENLLNETTDINAKDQSGNTLLHYTVWNKNESIVALLLNKKGININTKNTCGNTPLFLSIWHCNASIVKLLLDKKGIDINTQNKEKDTPLHYAVKKGNESIVKLLLDKKGIDINAQNEKKNTPLHYAVKRGNESIVALLLNKKGININTKNTCGNTPLLYVAVNRKDGNENIVALLVKNGADINMKNNDGYTPLVAIINSRSTKKIAKMSVELLIDTYNKADIESVKDEWLRIKQQIAQNNQEIKIEDVIGRVIEVLSNERKVAPPTLEKYAITKILDTCNNKKSNRNFFNRAIRYLSGNKQKQSYNQKIQNLYNDESITKPTLKTIQEQIYEKSSAKTTLNRINLCINLLNKIDDFSLHPPENTLTDPTVEIPFVHIR